VSISAEALLVALLVGLVAGWLTAQILQRASFGLLADLGVGVFGAFLGGWLLPRSGVLPGVGFAAAIINTATGALLLLLMAELARGDGRRKSWLDW
jgi:uncharacterized membrane protein YeaQ/YmgE (transglycosylase-associated protein family)